MSGLRGHLDLLAVADADGRTLLRRQSFAPPIHISKPHHDGDWLVVNLASPTPGLFAGDRVQARVTVEAGARLLLTAPSANRVHTMKEGYAELRQEFAVAAGGCLDVWPEYLIPQAGSAYRQRTQIALAAGAALLWTETVAPGRAARGEVFAYRELRLATDIVHGVRHLVRERYRLQPDAREEPADGGGEKLRDATATLRARFPQAYYASLVCVHPETAPPPPALASLRDLHRSSECWLGASQPSPASVAVKVIAADSPTLRAAVSSARGILQQWLGWHVVSLRRITGAPAYARAP